MPRSNVVILTDPASDLSMHRNGVTVNPIQGEYSRDKLMLQRIRSYIVRANCINYNYKNMLFIISYASQDIVQFSCLNYPVPELR